MKVTIFTDTSIKSPHIKDGQYAAVVECITDHQTAVRYVQGSEEDSTRNRLELLAIIEGLRILTKPCTVEVVTSCGFIANNARPDNVEIWQRSEWKRARGKHIKNIDLWQQYLEEKEPHKIGFTFSAFNVYEDKLKELLKNEGKNGATKREH